MKAAISGSRGFLGRHIAACLRGKGFEVVSLPRHLLLEPERGLRDMLQGVSVVVHLSGAPVVGRWTRAYRQEIYNSRIITTRHLVMAMQALEEKPAVFICASGVGIYDEVGVHTEENTRVASGFLAGVVRDWEQEALKASVFTRTLLFRFGVVLGRGGGALKTMALPFHFGLGGRIGSGKQMMSWVHIDDVCRAVGFVISNKSLFGALNICSPAPVSNRVFTRILAVTLRRPAFFRVPVFALRLLYGGAASVVAGGQAAVPERLRQAGFQFTYPRLEDALAAIYTKKPGKGNTAR
jgi:uncharacterized protein